LVGVGSGFFAGPDTILTNYHVVAGFKDIEICDAWGTNIGTATVKQSNIPCDLAALKPHFKAHFFPTCVQLIADSNWERPHEKITVIGFPHPGAFKISSGNLDYGKFELSQNENYIWGTSGSVGDHGSSGSPFSTHDHSVLYLHPICHLDAGTWVRYEKEGRLLVINCRECKKEVARIAL
jgi:hypothetical protein